MSRLEVHKIIENMMILCWEQSGLEESVWLDQQKSYHLQILKQHFRNKVIWWPNILI